MIVKDGGWYITDGHFAVGPMKRDNDGLFRVDKEGSSLTKRWREDGFAIDDPTDMWRLHHSFDNDDPAMHMAIRPGEPIPHWERE